MKIMISCVTMVTLTSIAMSLLLIKKNLTLMMEWKLMTSMVKMNFYLMADYKSTIFASTVLIITASILTYTEFYITSKKVMFSKIILAFVISMIMVIFSPNLVSMLMGWEGLGMSSFALIMFYQNKKSMMSSLYTMMMNRIGDAALMMSMMMIMNYDSWMFMSSGFHQDILWIAMLMVSMYTKSAQIPFSSWLTEAMAAPTPVSALVHSSTLVTAGIYLMIRFEPKLKYTNLNQVIIVVSLATLAMASVNSLTEWDIKKLVALSTLSQLSIMFISIANNMYMMAFFHMIMHATFKALIFLCSSTFISTSNSQDLRKISESSTNSLITITSFNTASMILCSVPFSSSFYSKEIIMEIMLINPLSTPVLVIFMLSMTSTMIYSTKMIVTLNKNTPYAPLKSNNETFPQKLSKLVLLLPSIVLGNSLSWSINTNNEVIYLQASEKLLPVFMIVLALMITPLIYNSQAFSTQNSVMAQVANNMWFLKTMINSIKMKFMMFMITSLKTTEKGLISAAVETLAHNIKTASVINFKITNFSFSTMVLTMNMIIASLI
uniref:NADH:ubiquinone reductase (H(+)-translocating) n=1 Tax=Bemisia afer TaxID=166114 RepID=A0A023IZQ2_BEMAF|nr:NADH dehydrogenase subunit 5 [Bemisia afer]AHC02242.1 NADH dehydrogenase subunit 5 [Bemisia afer]